MITARQHVYLDRMGIDVWVRREPGETPNAAKDEVIVDALPMPSIDTESMDWQTLEQHVSACTRCPLHSGRKHTVFGTGNRSAEWMIIGEAPGADEDRQGLPFVGRAGRLLNAMLKAAGYERDDVFITNILKCRPPRNRDPKLDEAVACAGYLHRQITLVHPKIILAVGRIAAQNLLTTDEPLGRLRGKIHRHEYSGIPVIVTYHPAYLLRSPQEKRKVWEDLCFAKQVCSEMAP